MGASMAVILANFFNKTFQEKLSTEVEMTLRETKTVYKEVPSVITKVVWNSKAIGCGK